MKLSVNIKIGEVAELIKAKLVGSTDLEISGINEIHKVMNGDLTFVDHPKYYKRSLESAATTIIINKEVDCPEGKGLLISDDPFRDYNLLVTKFRPFEAASDMISSSAKIGQSTIIQPGTFIGNHVEIGENCLIHANASIYDHTTIGNNVIIHSGVVIGGDAFYYQRKESGYKKLQSCGRVIIHDNVEIGPSTTIDKGVSGDTIIGAGTKIDNLVQIGHGTIIGKNCLFASQVGIAGKVIIKDNVILWGKVGVSKDLTIEDDVVVMAQSGIGKDLQKGKVYFGYPAREAKGVFKEMALIKKLPEIWEKMKSD